MSLLLIISLTGFILSALLHIFTLFHIYNPPRELVMFLKLGGICMIYLSVFITKRKCNMPDIKDFKKAYISACPKWLMLSTGAVVIYTFAGLISLVYGKYFGVSISTNNVDHIAENYNSFSGYLMAFYALPFSILYSINKYIKEIENDK